MPIVYFNLGKLMFRFFPGYNFIKTSKIVIEYLWNPVEQLEELELESSKVKMYACKLQSSALVTLKSSSSKIIFTKDDQNIYISISH